MWIFVGVCLAFVYSRVGLRLWRLRLPDQVQPMLDRIVVKARLSIDATTAALVLARLIRRERVAAVGAAMIFTAWLAVALFLDTHRSPTAKSNIEPWPFVFMFSISAVRPLILTGLMAYDAVRGRADDGPRVARVVVPALTDYVRPNQLWAGRLIGGIVVPASALVAGVVQRHTQGALSTGGLVAAGSAGVLLLAIVELAGHQLVSFGQPAGSAVELAWDDALRSMQLRELYQELSLGGLTLSFFTLAFLDSSFIPVYAAALIVGVALAARGDSDSYFRRRLWPRPIDRQPA